MWVWAMRVNVISSFLYKGQFPIDKLYLHTLSSLLLVHDDSVKKRMD